MRIRRWTWKQVGEAGPKGAMYVTYADHAAVVEAEAHKSIGLADYQAIAQRGAEAERARIRQAVEAMEWWEDEVLAPESWVSRDLVLSIIDGEDK